MPPPSPWQRFHRCPRCAEGPLFAGFLTLHPACPACGLVYERESGQALGAAVVAYALSALVSLPLFLVLLFQRQPVAVSIGVPTLLLAVLSPLNVRLSRQLWAHGLYRLHGGR